MLGFGNQRVPGVGAGIQRRGPRNRPRFFSKSFPQLVIYGRTRSATVTTVPTVGVQVARGAACSQGQSAVVAKQVSRGVPVSQAQSAAVLRAVARVKVASQAQSPVRVAAVARTVAAGQGSASGKQETVARSVSVPQASAITMRRTVVRSVLATQGQSVARVAQPSVERVLQATSVTSPELFVISGQWSVVATSSASLSRTVSAGRMASELSSVSVVRVVALAKACSHSQTGTLVRGVSAIPTTSNGSAGALARAVARTKAVAQTSAAALARSLARSLSVAGVSSSLVVRAVALSRFCSGGQAPALVRQPSRGLLCSQASAAVLGRVLAAVRVGVSVSVAVIARALTRTLSASEAGVALVRRSVARGLGGSQGSVGVLQRVVGRVLAGGQAQALSAAVGLLLRRAAVQVAASALQRGLTAARSVEQAQVPLARLAVARGLSCASGQLGALSVQPGRMAVASQSQTAVVGVAVSIAPAVGQAQVVRRTMSLVRSLSAAGSSLGKTTVQPSVELDAGALSAASVVAGPLRVRACTQGASAWLRVAVGHSLAMSVREAPTLVRNVAPQVPGALSGSGASLTRSPSRVPRCAVVSVASCDAGQRVQVVRVVQRSRVSVTSFHTTQRVSRAASVATVQARVAVSLLALQGTFAIHPWITTLAGIHTGVVTDGLAGIAVPVAGGSRPTDD